MPRPLKLLIVEDNPVDAELLVSELCLAGFDPQWKRVETASDFQAELKNSHDIILSDYSMPQFTGLRAAELLRASGLDIPFILVSGTVGEDLAVAAMKQGATDYLLKDRLARLGSAVEQALAGKRLRVERKQAETALQEKLAMLNSLVTTIPGLIYFKDLQSRFVRINDAMTRRFGLRQAEEAVGKTDFDFHGKEHARQAYEDEQHVMQTGENLVDREEKETWPDGRLTWASSTKVPLRDPQGNITGLMGISRDITAAKKSEARFRRLVDSNAQGVIFWNTKGEITGGNDAFLQLTGHTRADLEAGRINWVAMTPPEYADLDQHALKELAATGICATYEKEWLRKDNSRVPIMLGAAMFEDNPQEGVCFVLDLTKRKRVEMELEKSHKELLAASRQAGMAEFATGVLHNVGNVLNSVNVATTCLFDSMKRSKSTSLAKVVALMRQHEADLGAFFTSDPKGKQVPGYLAQLADHLNGEHATALKELAELQKNVEHIKSIITTQQESAKRSRLREVISLTDLVEDALKLNANGLARAAIQVRREFQEVPPIMTERHMVLQILVNLVRNAGQSCEALGDQDKHLTVRLNQEADRVRIAVADNGSGIAPENLSRIFAHGFTTKKDGHGFGLHSAAAAAREMGGSLTVQSGGIGHGATFTLELPMNGLDEAR